MTLEEMREKIGEFLLLGKHWRGEKAMWKPIKSDEKGTDESRSPEGEEGLKLYLYTDRNEYVIVMYPERGEISEKSYLGCIQQNRAPWPGETQRRGGDLADGEFTDETLQRIWSDILSCELQVINAHKPQEVTEEVTGPSLGD